MSVNPDKIVKWLNGMLRVDPLGVNEILRTRIPCSAKLGDVNGINVVIDDRANATTSLLEMLGGLYPNHRVEVVQNMDDLITDFLVYRDANRRKP